MLKHEISVQPSTHSYHDEENQHISAQFQYKIQE